MNQNKHLKTKQNKHLKTKQNKYSKTKQTPKTKKIFKERHLAGHFTILHYTNTFCVSSLDKLANTVQVVKT